MCKELKICDTQQFKGSLMGKTLIYPYKKTALVCWGKRVLQHKDITFTATTLR